MFQSQNAVRISKKCQSRPYPIESGGYAEAAIIDHWEAQVEGAEVEKALRMPYRACLLDHFIRGNLFIQICNHPLMLVLSVSCICISSASHLYRSLLSLYSYPCPCPLSIAICDCDVGKLSPVCSRCCRTLPDLLPNVALRCTKSSIVVCASFHCSMRLLCIPSHPPACDLWRFILPVALGHALIYPSGPHLFVQPYCNA